MQLTYGHRIHIRQGDCSILPVETYQNEFIVACFSINKNYKSKIYSDQRRLSSNKNIKNVSRVVFCTSQDISIKEQDELRRQSIDDFGWILDIYDPHAIANILDSTVEGIKIRKKIFQIDVDENLRPFEFKSSFYSGDTSSISNLLSYTRNMSPEIFDIMCSEWSKGQKVSYTDLLHRENISKVQLTNVWYELSLFLVRETKTIFRGMSNDLEIKDFWRTNSGDLYYQINSDLVNNGCVKIKRIVIVPEIDENNILTKYDILELLKSCMIQEGIGCEVRLVPISTYNKYVPIKCNYFAIQDSDYLLMCDVDSDCAYIQKDKDIISKATSCYEELFSEDSGFSFTVEDYFSRIDFIPDENKIQIRNEIKKKSINITKSSNFIVPFWRK